MTAPSDANTSGLAPTDALRLVPVNARDLDALRYVLNRADDSNRIRTVMTTFTLPERETTAERLERLYAALKAAPASPLPGGGLSADVVRLVVAARRVAYEGAAEDDLRALDIAAEAFASRVPWDDEPDELLAAPTGDA